MKAVKIALAALAAVAALLVIAAVVVASLFDPNDYKGVVTDAFEARTGRSLTIEQDLTLSFFPWLAVETGGVTVGNAPEFGGAAAPFAVIDRAAARVKLLPLLDRRVEIGTIELDGVQLNLARNAELRGNWQDLLDAPRAAPEGAPLDPASGGPTVQSFALEGVRLRGGTLYWRENTSELRYTVTNLDFTSGAIGGGPVPIDASLQFNNELTGLAAELRASAAAELGANGALAIRDLQAEVTVSAGSGAPPRALSAAAAGVTFDRAAQTLDVQGLTTVAAGVRAAWQLSGSALLDDPAVQGRVTVVDAPLAEAFEQLGWEPPPGLERDELGTFAVAAEFALRAEPREIRVTGVDAQLFGMRVRGDGALAGSELTGRIEIPEFAPNAAVQSLLRSAVPPTVDVGALRELAFAARFETNLDTGSAALRELEARVFGATISGELEAVPGSNGNMFRGAVTTSRFAPDAFAEAFAALLSDKLAPAELGAMRFDARFVFDTGADTVSVAPFRAELFGLSASGELTGRSVSRTAAWTGRASVAQFSPQDLIRRFGLPAQPTSDPRALTSARIDTRFDVGAEQASFSGIVLALDDSTITGDFTVRNFDAPEYRFALAVDAADADRYLPPKARDADAGEATAGDLELPRNNTMNLDGTMQIGELRLAGMRFEGVGSRIVIGNGDARLEDARARLYGGEFAGSFRVRAAGNEPGLALAGKASGLQLEPLIEALTGEDANFSGTGNFDLDLAGHGRTVIDNVASAAGTVSFALRGGAIKGFNLGRTLCSAYNLTQSAPGPRGEQPLETRYEVIQGTAAVTNGSAHSPDLLARTSFMDINGRGALGLVEQRLDYDFDAKLTGKIAIPGCETMDGLVGEAIPFNIRGTIAEPAITPDFSKLIQRRVREELQERLQDRIQDRLRDILR